MPDTGPGRGPQSWFANKSILWGVRGIIASLLAGGVVNALAAKDKKRNANKNDDGEREPRDNKAREEVREERADRRERNRDEETGGDDRGRRENNRDRERDNNDSIGDQDAKSGRTRRRDRDETNSESDGSDSVSKRQNNNNNNNNNSSSNSNGNNNNNRDDEPDDTTDDTEDDSDRGNRGNAGSGFFDQPLATKARRRSNDFEGEQEEDDGIVVDVDPEGESTYETGSIFFSTGPEGLEVVTRNISYTAAPTPTPTPFPRLELPERERLDVFGDRTLATSTPVPSAPSAPTSPPPPPVRDVPADSGDTPAVTPPPSTDTSGGDTSGGFLS